MANMVGGRERLLQLCEIFKKSSDEKNPLTKEQISRLLWENFGVHADHRTVRDDINCLLSMGFITNGDKKTYYYTRHPFDDWELKMLIDGVAQTDYFEPRTLKHIIEKIKSLAGPTDVEMLTRNSPAFKYEVNTCDTYLSENLKRIILAIKELHPITFEYFKLDAKKEPVPHGRGTYTVHPYAVVKRNTFYYLVSYCEGDSDLRYFRIDRIRNVIIEDDQKRLSPCRLPIGDKTDEIHQYLRNNTDSFSGEKISVIIKTDESPSIIYDVFGIENVSLVSENDLTVFSIRAQKNDGLYHNLFRLGTAITILSPDYVLAHYKDQLAEMMEKYSD